jgi:hypothetical protein
MMKFSKIGLSALLIAMVGCVDMADETLPDETSDSPAVTEPTSVIDPATGELVAINYQELDSEPVYVQGDLTDKTLSDHFQDVELGSGEEVSINLQQNGVVVGIGARVAKNDNVTTLRVHARTHRSDGTLGPITEFRNGTEPNGGLEAWCAAPIDHVIVGVGGRMNEHNLTTLVIYTRRYNPATGKLVGQFFEKRCGSEPDRGLEQRIVSHEHMPDDMQDVAVMNGLSMRCRDSNLAGLRVRYRNMER